MEINDVMKLVNAGFSKEEIMALAGMAKQEPEPKPVPEPIP